MIFLFTYDVIEIDTYAKKILIETPVMLTLDHIYG